VKENEEGSERQRRKTHSHFSDDNLTWIRKKERMKRSSVIFLYLNRSPIGIKKTNLLQLSKESNPSIKIILPLQEVISITVFCPFFSYCSLSPIFLFGLHFCLPFCWVFYYFCLLPLLKLQVVVHFLGWEGGLLEGIHQMVLLFSSL